MQSNSKFFDDISRMMTGAAGLAQGVKDEAQGFVKARMEGIVSGMDFVTREEFEAVRDMAQKAREENDALIARLARLEARLARLETPDSAANDDF